MAPHVHITTKLVMSRSFFTPIFQLKIITLLANGVITHMEIWQNDMICSMDFSTCGKICHYVIFIYSRIKLISQLLCNLSHQPVSLALKIRTQHLVACQVRQVDYLMQLLCQMTVAQTARHHQSRYDHCRSASLWERSEPGQNFEFFYKLPIRQQGLVDLNIGCE